MKIKNEQWIILMIGETEDKKNRICCGQSPSPLSDKGMKDTQSIIQQLKKYDFNEVFYADSVSGIETWDMVSKELNYKKAHMVEELRERSCGIWEGKPYQSILKKLGPRGYRVWDRSIQDAPEYGESLQDVKDRFRMWYDFNIKKEEGIKYYLFITHEDTAKAIILTARPNMEDNIKNITPERGLLWNIWI